jgi:hypothetical protein
MPAAAENPPAGPADDDAHLSSEQGPSDMESEGPTEELSDDEKAWVTKWIERSPEWSAAKWKRIGQALGVKFSQ